MLELGASRGSSTDAEQFPYTPVSLSEFQTFILSLLIDIIMMKFFIFI